MQDICKAQGKWLRPAAKGQKAKAEGCCSAPIRTVSLTWSG
jgi:hypothetical protein